MDDTERSALAFLEFEGFVNVVYEPDGNVPPDFLLDGRIAVEVRRLNQHLFKRTTPIPLEHARYSLAGRITALLRSLGEPNPAQSWLIGYRFARPAPSWSRLEHAIRQWIEEVRAKRPTGYVAYDALPRFHLNATPANNVHDQEFLLGGYVDRDAGGFVVASLIENITHCVSEKEVKIAARRAKYDVWWLCLVDQIAHGLDEHDRAHIEQWLRFSSSFDRIVLVNATRPANSYTLKYQRVAAR